MCNVTLFKCPNCYSLYAYREGEVTHYTINEPDKVLHLLHAENVEVDFDHLCYDCYLSYQQAE